MGQVSITINDRDYSFACDDGQEAHLSRLADYVDKRIDELVASVGQVGNERLLVMVSLLVADELSDAYAEMGEENGKAKDTDAGRAEADEIMGRRMESLARRIENIAQQLEQP